MFFQKASHFHSIAAMTLQTNCQRFKTQIKYISIERTLYCTEITHYLHRHFGDICTFPAELFGVDHTVIRRIGSSQRRIFFGISVPVEMSRINNTTTYGTPTVFPLTITIAIVTSSKSLQQGSSLMENSFCSATCKIYSIMPYQLCGSAFSVP